MLFDSSDILAQAGGHVKCFLRNGKKKPVGLQYILDSRQKRMQGKRQSVIVELLHKTVRKELTLRGNYNTGYEV